ncbi:MAG: hypothetical protein QM809_01075 [Gordonia sp. (in: high G+C Gram-positive bacteria)]|uniref:hypothetical protein n=1 Tax=Gordonia sp. (in: high G+C Gram-positive bacteria) TaxID=84139 RepID=UPI0039E4C272
MNHDRIRRPSAAATPCPNQADRTHEPAGSVEPPHLLTALARSGALEQLITVAARHCPARLDAVLAAVRRPADLTELLELADVVGGAR